MVLIYRVVSGNEVLEQFIMNKIPLYSLITVLIFVKYSDTYTGINYVNTDEGYCEYPNGVLIPVGDYAIDKEKCERLDCTPGAIHISGCSVMMSPFRVGMWCTLVRGTGDYPDCCKHIPNCTKISLPSSPDNTFSNTTSNIMDYEHYSYADYSLISENLNATDGKNDSIFGDFPPFPIVDTPLSDAPSYLTYDEVRSNSDLPLTPQPSTPPTSRPFSNSDSPSTSPPPNE